MCNLQIQLIPIQRIKGVVIGTIKYVQAVHEGNHTDVLNNVQFARQRQSLKYVVNHELERL